MKQHKRCFFTWIILLLISIAILMLSVFSLCNPQTSKWIYLYQAYYCPFAEGKMIAPKDGYVGVWRSWSRGGSLVHEFEYKEAENKEVVLVRMASYYANGKLEYVYNFNIKGENDGLRLVLDEDGWPETVMYYDNGCYHGPWISIRSDGTVSGLRWYLKDEEVSKRDVVAAAQTDIKLKHNLDHFYKLMKQYDIELEERPPLDLQNR